MEADRAKGLRGIGSGFVSVVNEDAVTAQYHQRHKCRAAIEEISRQPIKQGEGNNSDQRGKVTNDVFDMSEKVYPNILQNIFRRQLVGYLQDMLDNAQFFDTSHGIMHDPGFVLAIRAVMEVIGLYNN